MSKDRGTKNIKKASADKSKVKVLSEYQAGKKAQINTFAVPKVDKSKK